ncbi:MASE1 domain-containing protein [Luteolibacter yonseiensis]|uniref:histidine kinase n=1 Tax=Luteolibacter yonseiensis TaxID=1144680 RepID=A0A934R4C5_9BACT|nr:ATP-binding protein [Luteolibacter yonseiensis]MBK1816182.1 MASE1 domain-containing protein [Luteolibacter yonseiensis]
MAGFHFAYHYGMSFSQTCGSPFWFPDSVLLCALLMSSPRNWWIFIFAALPIRLYVAAPLGLPVWFQLTVFVIDSAKGIVGALALRHFVKNPLRFTCVRDYATYALLVVLLIPALAAFAGAGARVMLGRDFWTSWEQWFMGNVLTHLVVTPALLCWVLVAPKRLRMPSGRHFAEAVFLGIALILTGYLAFRTESVRIGLAETRFYAPVPFLFWAAIRFGMAGASGSVAIIAVLAVEAALKGHGPFSGLSPSGTSLALQHFLLLRAAPLYVVAILIEQKKVAEMEAQEQRCALAHAARVSTMGQLASALAHEINQPLGAILRNAEAGELILAQKSPDLEEVRAILLDIRQDDQRAGSVIERMRSLLKRRDLEFEPVSIKAVLDQVMDFIRAEMRSRRVTVDMEIAPGLPMVRGDKVHLQQVLLNLLVNGADAMSGWPLQQRRLRVDVEQTDGRTVEISVRDFGHGIAEEKIPRVFEPFFTTKSNGMGMGLAISKTIVEAHGGGIRAGNHPEGGAVFRFTLKTVGEGGTA